MALIEVQHLKKYFDVPNGTLHAVMSVLRLKKVRRWGLLVSPDVENPHLERP